MRTSLDIDIDVKLLLYRARPTQYENWQWQYDETLSVRINLPILPIVIWCASRGAAVHKSP